MFDDANTFTCHKNMSTGSVASNLSEKEFARSKRFQLRKFCVSNVIYSMDAQFLPTQLNEVPTSKVSDISRIVNGIVSRIGIARTFNLEEIKTTKVDG